MLKPTRIQYYLRLMDARGFSADAVLLDSEIDIARFDDPSYTIRPEQCHVVVANMLRITGNRYLGFEIGTQTSVTQLGIIGYAIASSPSIRQMVEIWTKCGFSPVGFPFSFPVIISDQDQAKTWSVAATLEGVGGSIGRFYVEETLAMGIKNIGPNLIGEPFCLERIEFPYPKPGADGFYEDFFGCPTYFGAPRIQIVIQSPAPDKPLQGANVDLRELSTRYCALLAKQSVRHGPVTSRLRSIFETRGAAQSLEGAAISLGLNPRTLRRHLERENSSYQEVLDQFRCDLAKAYLSTGLMPPKEVSYLLGFSQAAAFRRAFKAWTGKTVGDYLAELD